MFVCFWLPKAYCWLSLYRFDKILSKEIPANVVYEDEKVLASTAFYQQYVSLNCIAHLYGSNGVSDLMNM